MIVLWGRGHDQQIHCVASSLRQMDAEFLLLDQGAAGYPTELSSLVSVLKQERGLVASERGNAMYLRPHPSESDATRGDADYLLTWADQPYGLIINPPRSMLSNGSKPLQMTNLLRVGFKVPETLITNDVESLREFASAHGGVVYKSCSGVRSIVSALDVNDHQRLERLSSCPTMFQRRIAGRDCRVHVVGHEVFATAIDSDAIDYRYGEGGVSDASISVVTIPPVIASACLRLARLENLRVAGIDLRVTAAEEWYCFEINPSPAFAYYDAEGEIGKSVARLLVAAE